MKRRVLILSTCAPPLPGHPVTGGGLRTAQLVRTVEQAGHAATLMVERAALPDDAPARLLDDSFTLDSLAAKVAEARPGVIVIEQWGLAPLLGEVQAPIVIDLHGSLLLENVFRRGGIELVLDAGTKIESLRRADLLLTPAPAQLHHFASWATVAGFDPRELPLALLPLALPEPPPRARRGNPDALRLVYGGARWPWIDSLGFLRAAGDVVAAADGATLDLFLYEPPRHGLSFDAELGTWGELDAALGGREAAGVTVYGRGDHAAYRAFLSEQATVALDLWAVNPERMLAATTRTVEFLWAGLPVITVEGAAWAEELLASGAGWTVPPGDDGALRELLVDLREHPAKVGKASRAATKLIAERHSVRAAGEALAAFLARPHRPPRAPRSLVEAMVAVREEHLQVELDTLRQSHEAAHDRMVAAHAAEVAEQRALHAARVEALSTEHREQVDRLTGEHRDQVAEQRTTQDERVAALTREHREATERITADHRAEIAAAVRQVQDRLVAAGEGERARLVEAHRAEVERLREAQAAELAQVAGAGREEVRRLQAERQEELARVVAEQDARTRELMTARQAEQDAEVQRFTGMVNERQAQLEQLREELRVQGIRAAEEQRALADERDARLGALQIELDEARRELARGVVHRAARKVGKAGLEVARKVSAKADGAVKAGGPRPVEGFLRTGRFAKLWVEHAIDL